MTEMNLIYLGVVPNFTIYSVPVILHNSNMGRMKMQNSKNTPKKIVCPKRGYKKGYY
jgi:hypothetical protein